MNVIKAEFPIILFWNYAPNTISYLSHLPIFHCRYLFKQVEANSYKRYAAPFEELTNKKLCLYMERKMIPKGRFPPGLNKMYILIFIYTGCVNTRIILKYTRRMSIYENIQLQ
jgi:hypothetical protein